MQLAVNMKIGHRLGLAFTFICAALILLGAAALYTSSKLAEADRWNTHTYKVLEVADAMLISMINMETGARGFFTAGHERFLEPFVAGQEQFSKAHDEARQLTSDNAAQQKRLAEMSKQKDQFLNVVTQMIEMRKKVSRGEQTLEDFAAEFGLGRDKAAMDSFRALQADFSGAEQTLLVERSATAESMRNLNRNAVLGCTVLGGLFAIILGFWITSSITRPLGVAVDVAERVAAGDLTSTIESNSRDEAGVLLSTLKKMNESLAVLVAKVRSGSDGILAGSTEIATGNNDLSQRTNEQASALQETAATMEELGRAVGLNADNARQANDLAQAASQVAAQGGEVVSDVVTTMERISESSRKIGDIIGVIDDIAFQTNILALNAAVEAARAGEQGRGFAVVAGEVRALAKRSAESAKEIKDLITTNVGQVQQGKELVDSAGTTMLEVVKSIGQVSSLVSEISDATVEQSQGLEQIGQAIAQMDEVTQQNAALVEESAAAAESLKSQAEELVASVSTFRLRG